MIFNVNAGLMFVSLLCGSIQSWAKLPDYPLSYEDLKVEAGYYTSSGKYRGGLPSAEDTIREKGECLEVTFANNSGALPVACMQWTYQEVGEVAVGECECENVQDDMYCDTWSCIREIDPIYMLEFRNCDCLEMAASGRLCQGWDCTESNSQGQVKFEENNCTRVAESGHFCEAWTTVSTSEEVIEVRACECTLAWEGSARVCASWNCEEYGLGTCATSGSGWCDTSLAVGLGGGVGFLGLLMCCSGWLSRYQGGSGFTAIFIGIVWCCGWAVGVVIWGGVDGSRDVGLMWGIPLVLFLCITGTRKSPEIRDKLEKQKKIKQKEDEERRVQKLAAKKEAAEQKLADKNAAKDKKIADKLAIKQKKADEKERRKEAKRSGKKKSTANVPLEGNRPSEAPLTRMDEE